jgi:hypothetical protein
VKAISYRLRVELRTGWRGVLALGLVVGIVAGAVLAFAAGGRRTDSAYRRFLVAQNAYDVMLRVDTPGGGLTAEQVKGLPQVSAVAETGAFFIIGFGAGVGVVVPPDERIGTTINKFKMLEGRRVDPRNPSEAVVSFTLADRYDVRVGDRIQVLHDGALGPPPADMDPGEAAALIAARDRILEVLPRNSLKIVGIEAAPGEFPPQIEGSGRFLIHASPALFEVKDELAGYSEPGDEVMVRLENGDHDTRDFLEAVERLGGTRDMLVQPDLATSVNRSLHTQAIALYILSLLTAIAGALILSQVLSRYLLTSQDDARTLAALGMRRWDRFLVGLGRALAVGLVAAPVAVVTAAAASSLFPSGLARIAEPDLGVHLDWFLFIAGAVLIVLAIVVLAAWPAWRAAGTSLDVGEAPMRLSSWARVLKYFKAPAPIDVAVRMAFAPGHGRRAVAGRASLAAVTVGAVTVVGALVFGASLSHLLSTPALYGRSWDAAFTTYDEQVPTHGVPILAADSRVAGVGVGMLRLAFDLDGTRVDGLAVDTIAGGLRPTILEGRRPRADDEIVVGTRTMRSLDRRVGDILHAAQFGSDRAPVRMRIVGRAVFPLFGELGRLGDGAFVTREGWSRVRGAPVTPAESAVLVRLAPAARVDAVKKSLETGLGNPLYGVAVISQGKPTDIVNFGRVEATPYVLGGVLAAMSIGILAYILVSAVRSRRRELAILKTLGFVRRQVRTTVAWHATSVALVALLLGIPLGAALGRWAWSRFANDLGVVEVTVVPISAIAVIALLGLAIANLTAAIPAVLAARTQPADALRSE